MVKIRAICLKNNFLSFKNISKSMLNFREGEFLGNLVLDL
jgi:hypothetical protein